MAYLCASIIVLFTIVVSCARDNRRPFYNIAHMVNGMGQIMDYLDFGANALEADIQFYANGSVKEVYHGLPCDCFRSCTRGSDLGRYLQYVRYITDPSVSGNYANQMVMLMFDLKLSGVRNKKESGRDLARHVLDFLWSRNNRRDPEIRVLVCIDSVEHRDVFEGFIEEFQRRGKESRLEDVGFDGGLGDIDDIRRMFEHLGFNGNIWLGDGITNCISGFRSDARLRWAIYERYSTSSFVKKVYHWTIDWKFRMRLSLNLLVDGMITNDPDDVLEVLQEYPYKYLYRMATPKDNPFERR